MVGFGIQKKRSIVSLDPGVYRFNFEYRYGFRYAYKEKIIYSNVFKIQGRKRQKEEVNLPEVEIPDELVILEKEATLLFNQRKVLQQ